MTKVFDKTEKGREEIATRKYHLSPRIRSLLVMIDGKQTADELLKKVAGLGVNEQAMTELLQEGFIQEAASLAITRAANASSANADGNIPAPAEAPGVPHSTPLASPSPAVVVLPEGQTQFEAIYRFYNETIKSTIGLRGYGLQLKVEKAASIDDFRQLKKPYLEAVLKAQGQEMARSLRDRLDKLLYLGEPIPETTTIAGLNN
ncbi:hypothetical protein [Noviherbaspirillum aerium]|uniref:hypothetical protein n=1 Tax=Noviherbaspirillum aerium TaxID=2588497 RepID=UPI00124E5D79|nr:hypothetical protein [Noviherbaspirillum aerium]